MDKLAVAKKAIDQVFGDTTVAPETTRERLEELKEHIEACLDTLPK